MKCFSVHSQQARFRNALGKFDLIFREYYADTPAGAVEQFKAEIETNRAPEAKEIRNPFDAGGIELYVNNSEPTCMQIRRLVTSLRNVVNLACIIRARDSKAWHDDPGAADHPLYHAGAAAQYPREVRDAAILELVKTHLQVITDNEKAEEARRAKQ